MSRSRRPSRPRQRARRLPPAERRALLLDAAIQVFARRGLGAGRPTEVAEAAEVSEATVYVYFPTREALVTNVLDEVGQFYLDVCCDALDGPGTLRERLEEILRLIPEAAETYPHFARVWFDWSSAVHGDAWPRFLETQDRIIKLIAAAITAGRIGQAESWHPSVSPEDFARIMVGICEMISRIKLEQRPPREAKRFVAAAMRVLFGD